MARLSPAKPIVNERNTEVVSFSCTPSMYEMLLVEMKRVNAKNRSELVRMIVEEYFNEEV